MYTVNSEIFAKLKPWRNGKITLSFIDIGISCLSHEFFTSQICLLMLFAKIKFSRKFPNLQYSGLSYSPKGSENKKLFANYLKAQLYKRRCQNTSIITVPRNSFISELEKSTHRLIFRNASVSRMSEN